MPALQMKMKHGVDPKKALLDEVGDLSNVTVFHNNILVATYRRPAVTSGGIHLTDKQLAEDKYQGKVGLVLAKGPMAFTDDEDVKFYGQNVEVGDWIVFFPRDAPDAGINGAHCRFLKDSDVRARVPHPDMAY